MAIKLIEDNTFSSWPDYIITTFTWGMLGAGTSIARIEKRRPLFHANIPPKMYLEYLDANKMRGKVDNSEWDANVTPPIATSP